MSKEKSAPRHLLSVRDCSPEWTLALFRRANELRTLWEKGALHPDVPHFPSKIVLSCFFEPSTRTRVSFEMAGKRLGAQVINLEEGGSSLSKGETVFDTLSNCEAMDPDLMILRHGESGLPVRASRILKTRIINAGDGLREHPTQALLDLYTLWRRVGEERLKGLRVVIVGDITHSRVASSDIMLFKQFGIRVTLSAPPLFLSSKFGRVHEVPVEYDFERALVDADVLLFLRVQKERHKEGHRFYPYRQYQLNRETYRKAKREPWIMHPGPINWGVEMEGNFIDHERSLVLEQVQNGLYIRMAIVEAFLKGEKVA